MSQRRLKRAVSLLLVFGLVAAVSAAVAGASAMVQTREVRLELNASFQPRDLPAHSFAPVEFEGGLEVSRPGGGVPPALQQIVLDFDRDGRLDAGGLPRCAPETIAAAGVAEARRLCKGAIVGTGKLEALIGLASGPVATSSPLTLFNGPAEEGHPTVILHAQTKVPATQTFAIVVPIEKRPGFFRYRATVDIPSIAGGLGAITKIGVKIGRRYIAGGKKRSYVAARCSDHILRSQATFTFANGLIVEGTGLEKYCAQR